jgi:succinoglycan biosynthesis protein ExoO
MNQPDVSVVVAAFNAASFVERAIGSALASTGVVVEVVVVDDVSTDDTWALLQRLAATDSRIVIDRLVKNGGPSAARNRAVLLGKGRYIAVLDADDTMAPERLAALVRIADSQNADLVADNMLEVDASGQSIGVGRFLKSVTFQTQRAINLEMWIAYNQPMKAGDCLGYLKPLIRRVTLDKLKASYDPLLRNSEDYYLVADLLARGARMTYTPQTGYHYTRAAGSTSHRLKPEHTKAWLDAEARFGVRHAAHLTPLEHDALAHRMRALKNVDQFVAAADRLKSRRIGAFVGLLVSDLRASVFTLSTFARVGLGKLLRKPIV